MDTKSILEIAMIKCSVRYNQKDINAWMDTKTHGQIAKDLADQLYVSGYCLQKVDNFGGADVSIMDDHLDEVTNLDGE